MEISGGRTVASGTFLDDLPVHVGGSGTVLASRVGVREAPTVPGCYLFRDADGAILYTGKSVALRTRLANYYATGRDRKAAVMTRRAKTVEWYATASEVEALILESALIKRFQPPYNVQLRTYPHFTFLRLADPANEDLPYLETTQGIDADGHAYFGPFWDRTSAEQTRDFVNRLFRLRICEGPLPSVRVGRTCLHGQIHRCQAPCLSGEAGRDPYRLSVTDAATLLRGDTMDLIGRLDAERNLAAEALRFERAAELHQMAHTLRTLLGKRRHLQSVSHTQNFLVIVRNTHRSGTAKSSPGGWRADQMQVLAFSGARLQGQAIVTMGATGSDAVRRRADLRHFVLTHFPTARSLDIDLAELDQMHVVASWLAKQGRTSRYVALPDGALTREGARTIVAQVIAAIDATGPAAERGEVVGVAGDTTAAG